MSLKQIINKMDTKQNNNKLLLFVFLISLLIKRFTVVVNLFGTHVSRF
jgi:hypothetical protein